MLSLKCPHKPHCFQLILPSPWSQAMPKVPPRRPVLLVLFGDICCHVQILFLAEPSLDLLRENRVGNYFYLSGIDCVNTQNNASMPWSSSCRAGQQLLESANTQKHPSELLVFRGRAGGIDSMCELLTFFTLSLVLTCALLF